MENQDKKIKVSFELTLEDAEAFRQFIADKDVSVLPNLSTFDAALKEAITEAILAKMFNSLPEEGKERLRKIVL